jgi:ATP-dependent DNA helicase RecQ
MTANLDRATETLKARFGYPAFRSGQQDAVTSVLGGGDTLVVMPTGGGKSLCYQVPALILPKLTVVVSPLISLMKDQVDALTARGLPATFVNSTLSSSEVAERLARAQRGEIKLLYVAPERFDAGSAADRLRAIGISLLAVDEAHCISEWGHDFRPSYRRMAKVREQLGSPPTIALTATATAEVRRDIVKQLGLRDPRVIVTGFDRKNLNYHVKSLKNPDEKDSAMVSALEEFPGLAVVYASTRKDVERVAGVLERGKVRAVAYHAGLDPRLRQEVQEAFMTEGVRAIVATNAFGMGIDKPNVRLVVHHSMPGSLEAYYQEAGRAGRDGAQADCVLLHSFPDRFTHEFFLKCSNPERPLIEKLYAKMREKADPDGTVRYAIERLAGMLDKVNDREVEAALRVLVRHGAVIDEQETSQRVSIRMLATADRIKRELTDGLELGLLRALWRLHGDRLYDGVSVDPGGLPPGFSGASGTVPLLESLQERHFLTWNRTGGGLRLADPRLQAKDLPVDWPLLERRRRAELNKLEMMQKYAYTPSCRRDFVLRYFGDPAARGKCEGCDNCLGTHVKATKGPRAAERAPRKRGERSASGSSLGRDRSRAPKEPPDALEPRDAALFTALKRLRASIAAADKVPAYVICPDRTLAEIASRRPRSTGTLEGISGLGPVRIEKYGERMIQVVKNLTDTEAA